MPKVHKPHSGSMQYWPRVRAKRIYPRVSLSPDKVSVDGVKPLVFAAYKAGMTHVMAIDNIKGSPSFNQTRAMPVSVLDAPPLFVLGVRFYVRAGHSSVSSFEVYTNNLPKELRLTRKSKHRLDDIEIKKNSITDARLIVSTQPTRSGLGKKTPEVFEIDVGGRLDDKINYAVAHLGKELHVQDVFKEGQFVDVTSVTKGKGFQGVVKRFGVRVQGRKNEQAHRQIGIHGPENVGRIRYTIPMAGQMGFHRRTEYNKQIVRIAQDGFSPKGGFVNYGGVPKTYVFLKGSVPGQKKRLVMLRAPLRAPSKGYPVAIQEVSVASQQGVRTR